MRCCGYMTPMSSKVQLVMGRSSGSGEASISRISGSKTTKTYLSPNKAALLSGRAIV